MRQIARLIALIYLVIIAIIAGLQVGGLTQFSAPIKVLPVAERPPITVSLGYSSEQRDWLTAAAQQFAATSPSLRGRPIQLVLQDRGSQTLVAGIEANKYTAIIPASSSQISAISGASPAGGESAPRPIALSPLVLVGWQERTSLLFPAGTANTWQRLHDALQLNSWSDPSLGGKSEWGPVKFGHASPRKANSGSEALTLMAYAYHNKLQGLSAADISAPAFQAWLREIEGTISSFPDSTESLFNTFLASGPSAYDLVVAYENQAVANINNSRWGAIQVIYPPATLLSDHPYIILDAAWVTPEQQEAARMFRDYLLSEPAQRLALHYGFRPANIAVPITASESGNLFPEAMSAGVRAELPGSASQTSANVSAALLALWQQQTGQ